MSCVCVCAAEEGVYAFRGVHLIASYSGCDHRALADVETLREAMHRAVEASGATILDRSEYVFPPDGLTMVFLLSESHASIHTYPEHDACFVDLFTCGNKCSAERFDQFLREYLRPAQVEHKVLVRGQYVEEKK
jgi:S-adenosylmethionine decarboxylase